MAFSYGFYDSLNGDRRYKATDFNELVGSLLTEGVFENVGQKMMVTAGSGMDINVGSGKAWFDDTWSVNDSTMVLTVPQSDITRPRYDTVVLEVNAELSVRENKIKIVSGTPAVTPTKPVLTNSGKVHQHPLAYILVPAAATAITASNIEVTVGRSDCPFVTGVLQKTDITDLYNQWNADFQTWFNNLKDQLTSNVVTNLQAQIDALGTRVSDAASVAEVNAGTVGNKYVSPATLKASSYGTAANTVLDERTGKLVHVRSEFEKPGEFINILKLVGPGGDGSKPSYSMIITIIYGAASAQRYIAPALIYRTASTNMLYICCLVGTSSSYTGQIYQCLNPGASEMTLPGTLSVISGVSVSISSSYISSGFGFCGNRTYHLASNDGSLAHARSQYSNSSVEVVLLDAAANKAYKVPMIMSSSYYYVGSFKTDNYWGYMYRTGSSRVLYWGRVGANPTNTLSLPVTSSSYIGFSLIATYANTLWLLLAENSTTNGAYKIDFSSGTPSYTRTSSVTWSDITYIDGRTAYRAIQQSGTANIYARMGEFDLVTGGYTEANVTSSGTIPYAFSDGSNVDLCYIGSIDDYAYFSSGSNILFRFHRSNKIFSMTITSTAMPHGNLNEMLGRRNLNHDYAHLGKCILTPSSIVFPEEGRNIDIYSSTDNSYDAWYGCVQAGGSAQLDACLGFVKGVGSNWNSSDSYQNYTMVSGTNASFIAKVDY